MYCQSEIEGDKRCDIQCNHCREYYKPLLTPEEFFIRWTGRNKNDMIARTYKYSADDLIQFARAYEKAKYK